MPGQKIMGGFHRRLPQAVMGRQVAIGRAEGPQPVVQHQEMTRLIIADRDPIVEKLFRQAIARKPGDDVESEIDCVEFDMRQRMQQCDPAFRRGADLAARHVLWAFQHRMRRAGRASRHRARTVAAFDTTGKPVAGDAAGGMGLAPGIRCFQNLDRRTGEGPFVLHVGQSSFTAHSDFTAASTSST